MMSLDAITVWTNAFKTITMQHCHLLSCLVDCTISYCHLFDLDNKVGISLLWWLCDVYIHKGSSLKDGIEINSKKDGIGMIHTR